MAGGITGAKVSVKIYEKMEAKMQARREIAEAAAALAKEEMLAANPAYAKYLDALEIIDASPEEPLEQI